MNNPDPSQSPILNEIESEAESTMHPLLEKILNNLKLIGTIIGAIVLLAGGISGYKMYKNHQIEQATSKLESILSRDDAAAKAEALDKFAKKAPDVLSTGVRLELARALMQNGDYRKAAKSFAQLQGKNNDLQPLAILGKAKALILADEYAKAVAFLERNKGKVPEQYQRPLSNMLAYSAEKSGNWQKALSAYQELKSQSDMFQGQGKAGFFEYKINKMQQKMAG